MMTIRPRDTDVLVVIDVQNDFCPGGALAVAEGDKVVALVNRLMRVFPHVVLTQDWHPPGHASFASRHAPRAPFETVTLAYGAQILWPDHCVQGTPGAAFAPGLDIDRAELVLRKGFRADIDSYSAFLENDRRTPTGLEGYLRTRGLARVILAGLALDVCVRYSAEDARRLGFEALVVADACRAIDSGGSLAAAHDGFAAAGVHLVHAADFGA